jgi:hypothetical protein
VQSGRRLTLVAVVALVLGSTVVGAQGPPGGRAGGPPRPPREAAPVDFTGYWVSVVTEDWRWRMVTPALGDYAVVPLNAAAQARARMGSREG